MERDWGILTKRDGILARRYKITNSSTLVDMLQKESNCAFVCYMELLRREKGVYYPDIRFSFMASQTCSALLGLKSKEPNPPKSDLHTTPHDEDANARFNEYIESKEPKYFAGLLQVYSELITAFGNSPKALIWDANVHGKYLMTLERKKRIYMYMMLQVSVDKTRANHNYIVRSISQELLHVLDPNNHDAPPKGIALLMHQTSALGLSKTFPTVGEIDIANPFPAMLEILQRAGLDPPYTVKKFLALSNANIACHADLCDNEATQACGGNCNIAVYCSQSCADKDWHKHKNEFH